MSLAARMCHAVVIPSLQIKLSLVQLARKYTKRGASELDALRVDQRKNLVRNYMKRVAIWFLFLFFKLCGWAAGSSSSM